MDRNGILSTRIIGFLEVALRKESVDRNVVVALLAVGRAGSLSARRAWIEMFLSMGLDGRFKVALRKESVDRNKYVVQCRKVMGVSLSARRAWIEITCEMRCFLCLRSLSARRAWIEISEL